LSVVSGKPSCAPPRINNQPSSVPWGA
jgi:hypothetical protein